MMWRLWLATGVTAACLLAAGPALAQRGGGGGGGHSGGGGGGGGRGGAPAHTGGGGSWRGGYGAGYYHYYPGFYPGFYGYGFGYYPWPYGYQYWGNDPDYYPLYGRRTYSAPYDDYGPASEYQMPAYAPNYAPSVSRPPASQAGAQIAVHVPADAKVWFDGEATSQSGTDRLYESPPVDPGREYAYDIRAQWKEGGQEVNRTRHVRVYAGDRLTIDFTKPGDSDTKTTDPAGK